MSLKVISEYTECRICFKRMSIDGGLREIMNCYFKILKQQENRLLSNSHNVALNINYDLFIIILTYMYIKIVYNCKINLLKRLVK